MNNDQNIKVGKYYHDNGQILLTSKQSHWDNKVILKLISFKFTKSY